MSANTNNTPLFDSNTNENIIVSNEQSYDELIGYCALRKQFNRIIPSYYTKLHSQPLKTNRKNISSIEEYKKLKEEINNMKDSIELLKDSKQKKLKEIEELRNLMRKVGNKQLTYKDKKPIINNNIKNNYCSREKSHIDQCFRCERKESSGFKVSSDEGLSLAPTTSGLSSGKDDDCGAEEGGNPQPMPYGVFSNSNNSSTSSWCFIDENNRKELTLPLPEKTARTIPLPTN